MNVTWLGGEHDGEVFAVQDGTREVAIALQTTTLREWLAAPDLDPAQTVSILQVTVPLMARPTDGKVFAVWGERRPR